LIFYDILVFFSVDCYISKLIACGCDGVWFEIRCSVDCWVFCDGMGFCGWWGVIVYVVLMWLVCLRLGSRMSLIEFCRREWEFGVIVSLV